MTTWLNWPLRIVGFIFWFAGELGRTSWAVLKDILTPGQDSTPGIVRYETRCTTDAELTILAALITLTPGTLTLGTGPQLQGPAVRGVSGRGGGATAAGAFAESRVLYVHAMYNDGVEDACADLADLEAHLLHAMRREGAPQ